MGKSESSAWFQTVAESSHWNKVVSFLFGAILVVFLGLLGLAIENTTEIVDFSSPFITVVQAASIGLGMGYYLGASLKSDGKSRQWILLGVFSTLTLWGIIILDTQLFWRVPTSILIPLGGILSIFAHITPAVQNNEDYKNMYKFISGLLTTIVVILLRVAGLLLTLIERIFSATPTFILGTIFVVLALLIGAVGGAWAVETEKQRG